MSQSGMIAVITIMLALIIKAALEAAFKPVFDGDQTWSNLFGLPFAQLILFFLLTLRFYLGALRFGNTEPNNVSFVIKSFNFVFSAGLFCVFYTIALSVTQPEYFYLQLIVLHAIDAVWFSVLYILSHFIFVNEQDLEDGELPIGPVRRIMLIYLAFSIVTIGIGLIVHWWLDASLFDPNPNTAHWVFFWALGIISVVDLFWLRDYYFNFETWKGKFAIRKHAQG